MRISCILINSSTGTYIERGGGGGGGVGGSSATPDSPKIKQGSKSICPLVFTLLLYYHILLIGLKKICNFVVVEVWVVCRLNFGINYTILCRLQIAPPFISTN